MIFWQKVFSFSAMLILAMSGCVFAEPGATDEITGDITPMLLKLIGAMALILIVIYGSVWLMKKYSFGKMERGGNLISIVERRHLTPKQVIYLVKVGEKHLLVGSSESGLTKISDVEAIALRPPQAQAVTSQSSKFNQLLKQAKETLIPFISVKEQELEAKS